VVLARRLAGVGMLPLLTRSAAMKVSVIAIRSLLAAALAAVGVALGGIGSATAQPADYGTLPVNPNEVTDSTAYIAEVPMQNPNGQPGVEVVYDHRDGTRVITNTIAVLADAPAATAAMDQARGALGGEVVRSTTQPAPVGTGGSIVSGSSPDGTQSVSVLTFTEGAAFVTIEFNGPPNDPVPVDLVNEYGQRQATAIRDALSA
jgi:hypothetical protein